MKRILSLLIISAITTSSFAQTINKVFPYKDKKRDYFFYVGSFPVNNNQIITIFNFDKTFELHLYDENFNEIIVKEITKKREGRYNTSMYLSANYLFIKQTIDKKNYVIKVNLNKNLDHEKFDYEGGVGRYSGFHVDFSESNYYFPEFEGNTYLKKVNFKTKEIVDFTTDLNGFDELGISQITTFKDNEYVAVCRSKSIKKDSKFEVALHNKIGVEISHFNRLENNVFKSTVGFANNKSEIFIMGNYKEMPKKDELRVGEDHSKNPIYTGIYLKNMNSKKSIEKYYTYADFKNFQKQMIENKDIKKIVKFRFRLENMVFKEKEMIVFGTIDQDSYDNKNHDGQELKYIMIFAINESGEILWDYALPLKWKSHPKPFQDAVCKVSNFQKTVNIKSIGDIIDCHYLFDDKINYFQVKGGQIVNQKMTELQNKESSSYDLNFQYEKASYWYDNFYFNEDGISGSGVYQLDKIEFNK